MLTTAGAKKWNQKWAFDDAHPASTGLDELVAEVNKQIARVCSSECPDYAITKANVHLHLSLATETLRKALATSEARKVLVPVSAVLSTFAMEVRNMVASRKATTPIFFASRSIFGSKSVFGESIDWWKSTENAVESLLVGFKLRQKNAQLEGKLGIYEMGEELNSSTPASSSASAPPGSLGSHGSLGTKRKAEDEEKSLKYLMLIAKSKPLDMKTTKKAIEYASVVKKARLKENRGANKAYKALREKEEAAAATGLD